MSYHRWPRPKSQQPKYKNEVNPFEETIQSYIRGYHVPVKPIPVSIEDDVDYEYASYRGFQLRRNPEGYTEWLDKNKVWQEYRSFVPEDLFAYGGGGVMGAPSTWAKNDLKDRIAYVAYKGNFPTSFGLTMTPMHEGGHFMFIPNGWWYDNYWNNYFWNENKWAKYRYVCIVPQTISGNRIVGDTFAMFFTAMRLLPCLPFMAYVNDKAEWLKDYRWGNYKWDKQGWCPRGRRVGNPEGDKWWTLGDMVIFDYVEHMKRNGIDVKQGLLKKHQPQNYREEKAYDGYI